MKFHRFILVAFAGLLLLSIGCSAAFAASDPLADAKSGSARFGTNKVHYLRLGKGKHTVALIHGWGGNCQFWREQAAGLSEKARLILIDLPGHGESDKPKVEYTMDFFAGGVIAVLRDAGVNQATLVGHSMGVPVICRVYAQAPEKVAGLVAVDGLLRRPKFESEQAEKFIAPYRSPEYREHTRRFVTAMFPNPGSDALREWSLAQILATPQHVLSSAMDSMFKVDQPAWDLGKVKVPVFVINAKSPMWTAEYEAYVRSLSEKTEYQTIDGVGHFLMLEKPKEFNTLLVKMLQNASLLK